MSFDADLTACAALVEKADPVRFAAAMASPVAARRVLFPLYAFNVEVSRAPWVTQEPMIAEMRLQWWRDALEEIADGGSLRRHEVVTPLAGILDRAGAQSLDRLVCARRWDIYKEPFEDADHFAAYLDDTAAGLMRVAVRGLSGPAAPEPGAGKLDPALSAFGRATGLARFLQAVPALEAAGRIPLVDGRPEAIAALARQALAQMPTRRSLKKHLDGDAFNALTEGCQTETLLKQVARQPAIVASGLTGPGPLRRTLLLWLWS
jgi:phytoene synthase